MTRPLIHLKWLNAPNAIPTGSVLAAERILADHAMLARWREGDRMAEA
ncbi:hypothetical protein NYF14_13570 [Sphingobium sp. 10 DY56-G10]